MDMDHSKKALFASLILLFCIVLAALVVTKAADFKVTLANGSIKSSKETANHDFKARRRREKGVRGEKYQGMLPSCMSVRA